MENFDLEIFIALTLFIASVQNMNVFLEVYDVHQFGFPESNFPLVATVGTLFEYGYGLYYSFVTVWWAGIVLLFVAWLLGGSISQIIKVIGLGGNFTRPKVFQISNWLSFLLIPAIGAFLVIKILSI